MLRCSTLTPAEAVRALVLGVRAALARDDVAHQHHGHHLARFAEHLRAAQPLLLRAPKVALDASEPRREAARWGSSATHNIFGVPPRGRPCFFLLWQWRSQQA